MRREERGEKEAFGSRITHKRFLGANQTRKKEEKEKGGNAQKEPTKRQEKDFSILFLCDFFLNLT